MWFQSVVLETTLWKILMVKKVFSPNTSAETQVMDTLRSLEAEGVIYSALDDHGKVRWYATCYSPKPKHSTGTDTVN